MISPEQMTEAYFGNLLRTVDELRTEVEIVERALVRRRDEALEEAALMAERCGSHDTAERIRGLKGE